MSNQFNEALGQRFKNAREHLGLTLEEVSRSVGFGNYQTLSSIENGTRQIKAVELAKLAKIYLREISYFLNPQQEEDEELSILWRNCSSDNIYKQKEQEFLKYCYNYYELEKKLMLSYKCKLNQISNCTKEEFNYEIIEEKATEYRNEMKLGSRPACILEKLLEEKYNIKIIYLDLGNDGSAASTIGDFGTAILINSSEAPWRRNYDLAHELFHIITWNIFDHDEIHRSSDVKPMVEKWADVFASSLLLPGDDVSREFESRIKDNKISYLDLIQIAREFVVSTEALLWRLVTLRYLQRQNVTRIIDSGEIREIDKKQRLGDWIDPIHSPSIRYVQLASKAYQEGLISKGKLAEYLDMSRSELNDNLSEYGCEEEDIYAKKLAIA